MTDEFEVLTKDNENDVLNLINKKELIRCHQFPMFKIGGLTNSLNYILLNESLGSPGSQLLGNGLPCELLKLGSPKWRKGRLKIKLVLEFYPDEPESPLDDIRQMMKDNPQQDSV